MGPEKNVTESAELQPAARCFLAALLRYVFIDLRATACAGAGLAEIDDVTALQRVGLLADLFHNVPGKMDRAADGDGDYRAIVDGLWVESSGLAHRWLEAAARSDGIERTSPLLRSWR